VPERARSTLHNQAARQSRTKRPTASRPTIPATVRAALAARSDGICEMALPACTGLAVDPAHRIRTGMGGRKREAKIAHDVLSNLIHSCRSCHRWTHSEPTASDGMGLIVRDGSDPLKRPVLYRGSWRLLDDCGSVTPTDKPEEAAA